MSTATATKADIPAGPLPLHELGPAPDARRALALGRLSRHATNDQLIPAGLFDELDRARTRFLALRANLARRIQTLVAQRRAYRIEDAEHQAHIERVARVIEDAGPATQDTRTPADEREQTLEAMQAEAWAAVTALADQLSECIALVRHNEKAWLRDLTGRLPALRQRCAEAEKVVRDAELEERKLAATGRWIQGFADDEAFGVAPLTVPQSIPPGAQGHVDAEASLSRPWHRGRDWNPGEGAASRPPRSNRLAAFEPEPPGEDEPGRRDFGAGVGLVLGE